MRLRKISHIVFLLIMVVSMLDSNQIPVNAQSPAMITGSGTWGGMDNVTMTFPPAGGAVTGGLHFEGYIGTAWAIENENCYATEDLTLTGVFEGGDGGAVSGTGHLVVDSPECVTGVINFIWSGNYYADGTGSGELSFQDYDAEPGTWSITYSAEEFAAALPPAITSEYIFKTYGVIVEDSFGDGKYVKSEWTEPELILLNDALKVLPPDVIKNLHLKRIVRNKVYVDKDGSENPDARGVYTACGDAVIDPECEGNESTIRIFDQAYINPDFPDQNVSFKSTIIHELTHALQMNNFGVYHNAYQSPLVQNFVYATNKDASANSANAGLQLGWNYGVAPGGNPPPQWTLYTNPPDKAPTNYATTNPLEDMADSVRLYVLDPEKLKQSSTFRYEFVRDQIFGGVEYENGVQKQ